MIVVYTTVADKEQAKRLILTLLREKSIVCANYWPIESNYLWQGEIHEKTEVAIYLKTALSRREFVFHRLLELHPYDCPAIVSLDVEYANPAFVSLVEEQTER